MQGRERKILKFPRRFLWGVSISSHQVEGGNGNDWSEWEKDNAQRLVGEAKDYWQMWQEKMFPEMFKPENYISGRACAHYLRYKKDFDLAKSLGLKAFRLSMEWSRIEPQEGKFNKKEIKHYEEVIKTLKRRGLEPFVTLWHFTNPLWIRDIGGWENPQTVDYFVRYVQNIVPALAKAGTKFWMPLNEPQVYVDSAYRLGIWPPQIKNVWRARRVLENFNLAYKRSSEIIHKLQNVSRVGISLNIPYLIPYRGFFWNQALVKILDYLIGKQFVEPLIPYSNFIGLQYYFTDFINFKPLLGEYGLIEVKNPNDWVSDLGWQIYPEGIYHLIKRFSKYNKPIYVTENGVADIMDIHRTRFIKEHLKWIHQALEEGVDVRGYFYWSLLDDFEWDKGFWPRFGLIEVNYKNLKRKVRQSALKYARIIKDNGFSV